MAKFVIVTGGVVSSLGKGIFASSLGLLLKSRGLKIFHQKYDPYLNIDPGTMSPYQHGEVYVTKDTSGGATSTSRRRARSLPARSTAPSSKRSGAATTSGRPSRSFPT